MARYTFYVYHCARFYFKKPDVYQFYTKADENNWKAVDIAIKNYTPYEQEMLKAIFVAFDPVGHIKDTVDEVAQQYNVSKSSLFALVNRFSKEVAIERGLL